MERAESKWVPRLEWFFSFTILMGLYFIFFKEPGNEAQTVFRQGLVFGGAAGHGVLWLVRRPGK